MLKTLPLILLIACSTAKASEPTPTSRNFAVEDLAIIDAKLKCSAQYTDSGERHTHSCVIAEKQLVCVTNDSTVGLVCGPLVVQPAKAPEQAAPAQPATPPKAPKK